MTQPTDTKPVQLLPAGYSDIGDLGRTLGWDIGFRQLDAGREFIPARLLAGDHVAVLRMTLNRGYHQCAYPPPGTITFGIPEQGVEDWFGATYPDQSILPFNQASGIDLVSREGFLAYTISFTEDFLRDVSDAFQLPLADILYRPSSGALIPDSQPVQKLRFLIRSYFHENPTLIDNEQEIELAVELLRAGLGKVATAESCAPVARRKAIVLALDYIDACKEEVIKVSELSSAIDIPRRTLNRAFHERFGLGPKAYLNRLRLAAARNQISSGNEDIVIADVANQQGFWHMGQFARDYRLLYGELPSETLRRTALS